MPIQNVQIVVTDACATTGNDPNCTPYVGGSGPPYYIRSGAPLSASWTAAIQGACVGGTLVDIKPIVFGDATPYISLVATIQCP